MGDAQALDRILSSIRPVIVRYCRARLGKRDHSFAHADGVAKQVLHAVLTALPANRRPLMELVYDTAVRKVDEALGGQPGRVDLGDVLVPWLLDELPRNQREIIVLRVAVGLSAEQTAEAMGNTATAIRLAQHRALNRLRKATAAIDEAVDTVPIQVSAARGQSDPGQRQVYSVEPRGTATC